LYCRINSISEHAVLRSTNAHPQILISEYWGRKRWPAVVAVVLLWIGSTPICARVLLRLAEGSGAPEGDSYGELSPEDRLGLVHRVDLPRPVVMVGDGINDLAALAAADCGVAVRGGAQCAARAADACLAAEGIAPLATLLDGARRTMTTIH
jgi:hypothetical protein